MNSKNDGAGADQEVPTLLGPTLLDTCLSALQEVGFVSSLPAVNSTERSELLSRLARREVDCVNLAEYGELEPWDVVDKLQNLVLRTSRIRVKRNVALPPLKQWTMRGVSDPLGRLMEIWEDALDYYYNNSVSDYYASTGEQEGELLKDILRNQCGVDPERFHFTWDDNRYEFNLQAVEADYELEDLDDRLFSTDEANITDFYYNPHLEYYNPHLEVPPSTTIVDIFTQALATARSRS